MAVYDRFGRLIFGSPDVPRNVLEFVVFERHIVHPYGRWRIHGKTDGEHYPREPMQKVSGQLVDESMRTAISKRPWFSQVLLALVSSELCETASLCCTGPNDMSRGFNISRYVQ